MFFDRAGYCINATEDFCPLKLQKSKETSTTLCKKRNKNSMSLNQTTPPGY